MTSNEPNDMNRVAAYRAGYLSAGNLTNAVFPPVPECPNEEFQAWWRGFRDAQQQAAYAANCGVM